MNLIDRAQVQGSLVRGRGRQTIRPFGDSESQIWLSAHMCRCVSVVCASPLRHGGQNRLRTHENSHACCLVVPAACIIQHPNSSHLIDQTNCRCQNCSIDRENHFAEMTRYLADRGPHLCQKHCSGVHGSWACHLSCLVAHSSQPRCVADLGNHFASVVVHGS